MTVKFKIRFDSLSDLEIEKGQKVVRKLNMHCPAKCHKGIAFMKGRYFEHTM